MAKKIKEERLDGVYGEYGGKKRFSVSHPDFKTPLRVAAPTEDAAIVAAAESCGRKWTEYAFYAYRRVYQA